MPGNAGDRWTECGRCLTVRFSAPTSCSSAPELWEGLQRLEQVGDAPRAAREPRCHAAQDVLRLLVRAFAFGGPGMVDGIPLSRGDSEVECRRYHQDELGQPVRVSDLAAFQAEAARLDVGEHRLYAPAPRVVKRGEIATRRHPFNQGEQFPKLNKAIGAERIHINLVAYKYSDSADVYILRKYFLLSLKRPASFLMAHTAL